MGASSASMGLFSGASKASLKICSEKGPCGNDRQAKGNGRARAELAVRESKGRQKMVRRARTVEGEKFPPPENFTPDFGTDGELKAEFSALILPFPDKVLAEAADCSPDTVKCWKAERSFPHGRHLMKLVADFPKIRAWHDRRTGGLMHPQSQAEMYAELERIMASDTAEGRAMRARFQQIVAEKG